MPSERLCLSMSPRKVEPRDRVFGTRFNVPAGQDYHVNVHDVWVEADIDSNWRAAFRLVPYAGQPVVAELRVMPRDEWTDRRPGESRGDVLGLDAREVDGQILDVGRPSNRKGTFARIHHGLSAPLMRRVPFSAVRRLAKGFSEKLAESTRERGAFGAVELGTNSIGEGAAAFMFAVAAAKGGRTVEKPTKRGWSDITYVKLAAAYVDRVNAGSAKPVADVARRRRLSVDQVRDAIHTARSRGLLTEAVTRGRPGGQLTQKAVAMLTPAGKAKR